MPVTYLYCEGNYQSIDMRIINQLLPECDIRPLGGKTSSFLGSIIADRRRQANLACLVDRDFDCRDWEKSDLPIRYEHEGVWVGWSWARKEIENYLIDPAAVKRALCNKAPPATSPEPPQKPGFYENFCTSHLNLVKKPGFLPPSDQPRNRVSMKISARLTEIS